MSTSRSALILTTCCLASPLAAQTPGPVVISELMWMGSTASSADEWIELYNRSSQTVDVSAWVLTRLSSDGEVEMVRLKTGTHMAPGAVFLIANYNAGDTRSSLAFSPHVVDRGVSLANSKLHIRLYDAPPDDGGRLVDEADDGRGSPLAGHGGSRSAMVRVDFDLGGALRESWETALLSVGFRAGATERGTPGSIPARLLPASVGARATAVPAIAWGDLKSHPTFPQPPPDSPTVPYPD